MSSEPASNQAVIAVQGLGKHYAIYPRPQDRLYQALWLGRKKFSHDFWALRDISFEVRRGECVGIIGRNGAGKSTLLQLIVGTLAPSVGTVRVEGRVAALLELGSGFNPEFTGRENIALNATILGLTRQQIAAKLDAIIADADIGEFIDQPVKIYSTGMLVRLAFSVQIQVDPDVLIIDEALAVGDARFQLKCIQRLEALKQRGTSILFVTHDIGALKRFTDRSILLDGGRLIYAGDPVQAGLEYYKLLFPPAERATPAADAPPPPADTIEGEGHVLTLLPPFRDQYGKGGVRVTQIRVSGLHPPNVFHGGDPITVRIHYAMDLPVIEQLLVTNGVEPRLMCGIRFDTQQGIVLTDVATSHLPHGEPLEIVPADYRDGGLELTFRITMPELQNGDYFLSPGIALGTEASSIPLLELLHAIHLVCLNRQPVLGLMRWDYTIDRGHAAPPAPAATR